MRRKQKLAKLSNKLRITWASQNIRSRVFKQLPVINYHRIMDVDTTTFPFDARVISATPKMFEKHIQYISKNYTPITFKQLDQCIKGTQKLPSKPIIITFDDGYDDNYHFAYPILKKYNVPATFFVATGHIGDDLPFWYERVVFTLKHTLNNSINLASINYKDVLPPLGDDRLPIIDKTLEHFKGLSNKQRLLAVDELIKNYSNAEYPEEKFLDQCKTMTWTQCKEMAENGMEIGSHTVSHPILSSLTSEDLKFEVIESKRIIEEEVGEQVTTLAFPNGGPNDYNDSVMSTIKNHGYSFSASFKGGTNSIRALKHYELNRFLIENSEDFEMLPFTLGFPNL